MADTSNDKKICMLSAADVFAMRKMLVALRNDVMCDGNRDVAKERIDYIFSLLAKVNVQETGKLMPVYEMLTPAHQEVWLNREDKNCLIYYYYSNSWNRDEYMKSPVAGASKHVANMIKVKRNLENKLPKWELIATAFMVTQVEKFPAVFRTVRKPVFNPDGNIVVATNIMRDKENGSIKIPSGKWFAICDFDPDEKGILFAMSMFAKSVENNSNTRNTLADMAMARLYE